MPSAELTDTTGASCGQDPHAGAMQPGRRPPRIYPLQALTLRAAEIVLAAAVSTGLALVATYPAIHFWTTHFIGMGDTLQNAWNLWFVTLSVRSGAFLPSWTELLYHPQGVSLAYHPLSPLNGWMSLPLGPGLGLSLPAIFNTLVLFKFVATAVGMYVVVYSLGHSRGAAVLAAVVFTFAPARLSRVGFGNLEMYSTECLPWLIYGWLRLAETRRWRYAFLTAATLAMTGYFSLTLAFGAALLLGLLAVFQVWSAPGRCQLLRCWAIAAALTAGLLVPLVAPMVRDYAEFRDQSDQTDAATANSADLLGFVVPEWAGLSELSFGNPAEKQVFLGYSVLALLAALTALAWSTQLRLWITVSTLLAIFALGPVLHVAGEAIWPWMPYRFLLEIPLIGFCRTPDRLGILVMLAAAMALGLGWAQLQRLRPRLSRVGPLVAALVFVEFLRLPAPLDGRFTALPSYYTGHAVLGATLDVPVDLYGAQGPADEYMLYQTVHGQPIVGGYLSRTPRSALFSFQKPFVHALRARIYGDTAPFDFRPEVLAGAVDDLRSLSVRHVILHKDFIDRSEVRAVRAALTTALGRALSEDERLVVWRVP